MELKPIVTIYIGSFLPLLCLVVAPKLLRTMIRSVPHVRMDGSVAYTTYNFEVACTLQKNFQSVASTTYTFAAACTLQKNFQSVA